MEIRTFLAGALAIAAAAVSVSCSAQPAAALRPARGPLWQELKPCDVSRLDADALCGTYSVWEDREARSGRKIGLNVVVVPAERASAEADPLFFLHGGPGAAATQAAAGIVRTLARVHRTRDIVFVDQRGTGRSHPLDCSYGRVDRRMRGAGVEGFLLSPEAVAACRDKLSKTADLRLYTTPIAMDDLDEVRAALGYERINLYGGSYGTRAALVYLRRHWEHVRSVVLRGVAPTSMKLPLYMPRDAQRALDLLIRDCEADPACREAFPALSEDARAAIEQLPSVMDGGGASGGRVTREAFTTTLRLLLYNTRWSRQIPLILHRAAAGDLQPFREGRQTLQRFFNVHLSIGMMISVVCAEDAPFYTGEDIRRETEASSFGSFRARATLDACREWPQGDVSAGYLEPVRSDLPVLLLSGNLDPVTPPIWGEETARALPNSLHVVIPNFGHGGNRPCLSNLIAGFIEQGSARGLDPSCASEIKRPPFLLE